jgi:hypothetical protein
MKRNSGGGPPPTTETGRRDFLERHSPRLGRSATYGEESGEDLHEAWNTGTAPAFAFFHGDSFEPLQCHVSSVYQAVLSIPARKVMAPKLTTL